MDDPLVIEQALRHVAASSSLEVRDLAKLAGGLSRHTWRVRIAGWPHHKSCASDYILQVEQPNSLVGMDCLVDEYALCGLLADAGEIRVARPLLRGDGEAGLGGDFSLWVLLAGTANPPDLLTEPVVSSARSIALQSFETLGRIAACDWRASGLCAIFEDQDPASAAFMQLDRWEAMIDDNALRPMPIVAAARRHLRRKPPPTPGSLVLVHGDYRIGNYMFEHGRLVGVIDWEMAHLGDPLEDLGWALLENWRFANNLEVICGCITAAEALDSWEAASGLRADPVALRWWTILAHLKAVALWLSAVKKFHDGEVGDVTYALPGLASLARQQRWLLTKLQEAAQ